MNKKIRKQVWVCQDRAYNSKYPSNIAIFDNKSLVYQFACEILVRTFKEDLDKTILNFYLEKRYEDAFREWKYEVYSPMESYEHPIIDVCRIIVQNSYTSYIGNVDLCDL